MYGDKINILNELNIVQFVCNFLLDLHTHLLASSNIISNINCILSRVRFIEAPLIRLFVADLRKLYRKSRLL